MRTDKELISVIHQRAAEMEKQRKKARIRGACAAAGAVAVILILALFMPSIQESLTVISPAPDMQASLFSDPRESGYIVVGVVAFLLGIAVTVFCFHLKKRLREKEDADD